MSKPVKIDCTGNNGRAEGYQFLAQLNSALRVSGRPYVIEQTAGAPDGSREVLIKILPGSVFQTAKAPGDVAKGKKSE